jgi:hypothetical protein
VTNHRPMYIKHTGSKPACNTKSSISGPRRPPGTFDTRIRTAPRRHIVERRLAGVVKVFARRIEHPGDELLRAVAVSSPALRAAAGESVMNY